MFHLGLKAHIPFCKEERFVLKSSLLVLIFRMLGLGIGYLTTFTLVRVLGSSEYGAFVFARSRILFLVLFAKLGHDIAVLKFVPIYLDQETWGKLKGLLMRAALTVLVMCIATISIIPLIMHFVGGGDQGMRNGELFLTTACILPVLAFTSIATSLLAAVRRPLASTFLSQIFQPLVFILLLIASLEVRATKALIMLGVASLLSLLFSIVVTKRALSKQVKSLGKAQRDDRAWNSLALTGFLNSGLGLVMKQADILIVGHFLDPTELAYYAVATRLASLVLFGLTAANTVVAPVVSSLFEQGKKAELQKVLSSVASGIGCVAFPLYMMLVFGRDRILTLFGSEFAVSEAPLIILASAQLVSSLSGPVARLLTMSGQQKVVTAFLTISTGVNICLLFFLTPRFGILGASLATASTVVLWNIILLTYAKKKIGLDPSIISSALYMRRRYCKSQPTNHSG